MTNEQKAKELSFPGGYTNNIDISMLIMKNCIEMAEWKDEQFSIERKQLIEKANQVVTQSFENEAIFKKQEMIEKACNWIDITKETPKDGERVLV